MVSEDTFEGGVIILAATILTSTLGSLCIFLKVGTIPCFAYSFALGVSDCRFSTFYLIEIVLKAGVDVYSFCAYFFFFFIFLFNIYFISLMKNKNMNFGVLGYF